MHVPTYTELLQRIPLSSLGEVSTFGALSEETIAWLLNLGNILELDEGDLLFRPGEPGDTFFVILEGSVAYYKYHDQRYAYIRDYCKGQQIGFVSVIALHNRVGKAVARERTIALQINAPMFYRLHQEAPKDFGLLMLNLGSEMARTIRKIDNIIVDIKRQHDEAAGAVWPGRPGTTRLAG